MKNLEIVFYRRDWSQGDWKYEMSEIKLTAFLADIQQELARFDVNLRISEEAAAIPIRGYSDLLNSVRLFFPSAGLGRLCLGHIIGSSKNCDLIEDLRRGINRLVFAPETVEPDGSDKVVCHNCGCGC